MFVKTIEKNGKEYDLHLEFIDGYWSDGRNTHMGVLRNEMCFPAGENTVYTERIIDSQWMEENVAKGVISALQYGETSIEAEIVALEKKIAEKKLILDYIRKMSV